MDGQMLNTEIQGLSFLFGRREYMLSQRILFKDGLPRLTSLVMRWLEYKELSHDLFSNFIWIFFHRSMKAESSTIRIN